MTIYISLTYIAEAAEIKNKEEFVEKITSNLKTIDEEKIMTLAEQWKQEGFKKGKLEGKLEGKKEKVIEIAKAMLAKGIALNTISSVTDLPVEEIKKLMV